MSHGAAPGSGSESNRPGRVPEHRRDTASPSSGDSLISSLPSGFRPPGVHQPDGEAEALSKALVETLASADLFRALSLIRVGARILHADSHKLDSVIEELGHELRSLARDGRENEVIEYVKNILALGEALPLHTRNSIINFRNREKDHSALHFVINRGLGVGIIELLLEAGADVDLRAKFDMDDIHSTCSTALHAACYRRRHDLISTLAAHSRDLDALNELGDTPLLALYRESAKGVRFDCVKALVDAGADINAVDAHNETCLSQTLCSGFFKNAEWLASLGARIHEQGRKFKLPVLNSEVLLSERELLERISRLSIDFPKAIRREMGTFFTHGRDVYDLFLYAASFQDAARMGRLGTGGPLNALVPKLLFSYPPASLSGLFAHVDWLMDRRPDLRHMHPNEAEMMLLLNHPGDKNRIGAHVQPLIYSLSGITRFVDEGRANVAPLIEWIWARFGSETFFSRFYKYDAVRFPDREYPGSKRCLLERFGMSRIEERPDDFPLGTGYVIEPGMLDFSYSALKHDGVSERRKFDQDTYVEFSRGGYKVSHPVSGTIFVVNSNLDFGRSLAKHPVYWSPSGISDGFDWEDLICLHDPDNDPRFYHVLNVAMYNTHPMAADHVDFLIEQARAFRGIYREWKFDTGFHTAWADFIGNGERELIGGPLSAGFSDVVDLAEHLCSLGRGSKRSRKAEVPELGFVNPEYPAWASYEFKDMDGKYQRRVALTPDVINVMRRYNEANVTLEEAERTGLKNFFDTGFKHEAELVFLSPI